MRWNVWSPSGVEFRVWNNYIDIGIEIDADIDIDIDDDINDDIFVVCESVE